MADKMYAKTVHLHLGAPALGGRLSLTQNKDNVLEVVAGGVKAVSTKTNRSILIPFSNIVDVELIHEQIPVKTHVK